ncbi:SRPBCC domain-containing protein [Brachybacterium sp.]|uniref:SRPBCC domain-containing protein n=1 Tax=Brachybacterium sp. TaxID=1891286 RepID=UPI002ED28142
MTVTESLPVVDAVRRALEIDELENGELEIDELGIDGSTPGGHRRVRAVLTLTTNIALAPARLWPLLTRPAELARWLGPVSGDLHEGGRFEAPGGVSGRVLQIAEPHRLSLTWQPGADGAEEPLLLRLDPEDDGTTQLRLRHTVRRGSEEFARQGPGSVAVGWEIALLALAAHTDGWRGTCLVPAPAPTPDWLHGPQGADYLRAWSVRWAAEAIAAGVDEQVARAGERETVRRHLEV